MKPSQILILLIPEVYQGSGTDLLLAEQEVASLRSVAGKTDLCRTKSNQPKENKSK